MAEHETASLLGSTDKGGMAGAPVCNASFRLKAQRSISGLLQATAPLATLLAPAPRSAH